ncbi:hypothetical protein GN958_ATG05318 [Phytophthora infestans]|uniref:Uncharacterized protein n=1 Tax=Phytophthora infestans TaxID=4787 RepID=A0A8S9UWS3_PHYIN|nr:hypothetical protein GN958_ATG05318 [Phytophthora infestans]
MDPDKARKIAAVRKHVRDKRSSNEIESPAKRIIPSTEPPMTTAFGTPQSRSSTSSNGAETSATSPVAVANEDENADSITDIIAHWESVLSAMEDGDDTDLQDLFALADVVNRNEAAEDDIEEDTPLPERVPFPDEDDRNFPQESIVVKGLRGRKVSLAQLRTSARVRLDFTML